MIRNKISIMQIQIRTRGRITLPYKWREANHIKAGDIVKLTSLENRVILLRVQTSKAGRLANKLAAKLRKAGVTLTDLLEELRHIRK